MKKSTEEQKAANKAAREAAKEAERIEKEKNQKPVKSIKIIVEWEKSRTWGNCPRAEAEIFYHDGTSERRGGYTASGCGYDKESTVIAQIFNDFLKYKLWKIYNEQTGDNNVNEAHRDKPYGVTNREDYKYYDGGVGTSCYYSISEYIGGTFVNVASGKTFDVYEYTDNQ